MPVKMRLHRVGAKHQPSYRIVITPALTPRDGSYLDQVGFYNPVTEPATIRIDVDKAVEWLRKGVQPTDRVARLLQSVNINPAAVRRGETPAPIDEKPVRKATLGKTEPEATQAEEPGDEAPKTARRTRAKADGTEEAEAVAGAVLEAGTDEDAPKPRARRKAAAIDADPSAETSEASAGEETPEEPEANLDDVEATSEPTTKESE